MNFLLDGISRALELLVHGDTEVLGAAWRSFWISSLAVALAAVPGIPVGVILARTRFPGRSLCIQLFRTGMALPTVFVGLICFGFFSRNGPLGILQILYTPWAIVTGEFLLALPIIVSLTQGAIAELDPRIDETVVTLGGNVWHRFRVLVFESRLSVLLGLLTAFSRCVTELGIAMMVGGNLKGHTRTLSTATALETSRGDFATGMAMGLILLLIALGSALLMSRMDRRSR